MHRAVTSATTVRLWEPSRLHAERHRRRGVPAGVAPRALFERAEKTPTVTSRRRRRAGRHGVCHPSGKGGFSRVHLADAEPEIGGSPAGFRACPGSASGTGCSAGDRPAGEAAQDCGDRPRDPPRPPRRPRLARARGGGDGVLLGSRRAERHHVRPRSREPMPRLSPVLTPEQVMLGGKRPAGERVVVYDCEGYFMGAGWPSCWGGGRGPPSW